MPQNTTATKILSVIQKIFAVFVIPYVTLFAVGFVILAIGNPGHYSERILHFLGQILLAGPFFVFIFLLLTALLLIVDKDRKMKFALWSLLYVLGTLIIGLGILMLGFSNG
jgi:hypothetical protein